MGLKVLRKGGLEGYFVLSYGVKKLKQFSVQKDTVGKHYFVFLRSKAVSFIAENGMTDVTEVDSNLVSTAGVKETVKESGPVKAFLDSPVGVRRLAGRHDGHFDTYGRIAIYGLFDGTANQVGGCLGRGLGIFYECCARKRV